MIVFASTLVHASAPNISPMNRSIVYLSLCHVDNHIRRFKRPEWVAHRDFRPIEPLADDCLADPADPLRGTGNGSPPAHDVDRGQPRFHAAESPGDRAGGRPGGLSAPCTSTSRSASAPHPPGPVRVGLIGAGQVRLDVPRPGTLDDGTRGERDRGSRSGSPPAPRAAPWDGAMPSPPAHDSPMMRSTRCAPATSTSWWRPPATPRPGSPMPAPRSRPASTS